MSQDETPKNSPPPENFRAGFVAIVGRPNVGKSTLVNRLVGERVAITTPKPQTTRDRIRGIRTWDDWQAVYVDTPGIHEAKTLLHRYMVELAVGTLGDADLVYFLVDVAHFESKPEKVLEQTQAIVEALSQAGTPTFLVLNKVDHLKDKGALLPMIEQLSALYPFAETVPISALKSEGLEKLSTLTRPHLPESPPLFPEDSLTDRSMRFIAAELIREQLYRRLRQELPYQVAVSVDHWEENQETEAVKIYATIHVARDGHKGIVIGRKGETLKAIGQSARKGIESIMERRLYLDLKVRVQDKWTNDPRALRKLGYNEKT